MLSLLALAAISDISNQSAASAWRETRALCEDMNYVYYRNEHRGMGQIFGYELCYAAKDSRYLLYRRRERSAQFYGGSTRYPLITIVNTVNFYDGRKFVTFDAITEELQKGQTGRSLYDLNPALLMFWLDLRRQKGYTVESFKDTTNMLSGREERYRQFTLKSPNEEAKWFIEVRLRDGFVTYDWHSSTGGFGSQGSRGITEGYYMEREPRELKEIDWKPPKIEKRVGAG